MVSRDCEGVAGTFQAPAGGAAVILDADEANLYYSYSVGGVQYQASQDISALREKLPAAPERLIGAAKLKYVANNPANSILVCEEWSGVRAAALAPHDSVQ